jgi:peptide/nickel transport system substrate-binding protein
MFKDFVPNTHTELVKNPNYYRKGLPYLDGLTYLPVPDDPSRTADIQTGNVDFADQIAQKDIATLMNAPGVVMDGGTSTLHDYLFFNEKRKPFDDPRVRQAIAYALDRDTMTKLVLFGYGSPIYGGCIPPFLWGYDATLQPFKAQDMAKAKQLLSEAGLGGGFSTTLGASTAYQPQVDAAQLIKQYLAPLGITVQIVAEEWGTYINRLVNQHDYNMAIIGWIGAQDPDDYLYSRFHSNDPNNFEFYSNPKVDALLDQGRALQTQAQRKPIYDQIQSILATDSPMAWFYWYKQYEGVRDYVKGYTHMANASKATFLTTWLDK